MKINLNKQFNIGSWYGRLILSASQIGIVVSLMTMMLASIGAFNSVREWTLRALDWDLRLWQFAVGVVICIIIGVMVAHTFGLVSYMAEWNRQWWEHRNPMRQYLEEQEKRHQQEMAALETRYRDALCGMETRYRDALCGMETRYRTILKDTEARLLKALAEQGNDNEKDGV